MLVRDGGALLCTCVSNICAVVVPRSLPAPVLQRFVLEIKADLENIASCVPCLLESCACVGLSVVLAEIASFPLQETMRLMLSGWSFLKATVTVSTCASIYCLLSVTVRDACHVVMLTPVLLSTGQGQRGGGQA